MSDSADRVDKIDPASTQETNARKLAETSTVPFVDDAAPMTAGQRFGRFRIERLLGQGGMGSVYLAHDSQLDRHVALKFPRLSGDGLGDEELQKRFIQEAKAAATLSHPNLCPIYDVGTLEGQLYICMPFVKGSPLDAYLRNGKRLPAKTAALLVRKISGALMDAHKHGVVHRDLKPSNIMISNKKEPVIMDFGLARKEQSSDARLTQTGMVMGTPAYMSPEQISGDPGAMGPQCDIYSLGVILYEMLTGKVPFNGQGLSVISKILTQEPEFSPELSAAVDVRLQQICLKAMEKKAENRYATMADFHADIIGYLQELASPPKLAAEGQRAASTIDDLLAIETNSSSQSSTLGFPGHTTSSPFLNQRQSRKTRKNRVAIIAGIGFAILAAVVVLGIVFFFKTPQGTLVVQLSDPTATVQVELDGNKVDLRDGASRVQLEVGEHSLTVTGNGFETVRQTVVVKKGANPVFLVELTPKHSDVPLAAARGTDTVSEGQVAANIADETQDPDANASATGDSPSSATTEGASSQPSVDEANTRHLIAISEQDLLDGATRASSEESVVERLDLGFPIALTKSMTLAPVVDHFQISSNEVEPGVLELQGKDSQFVVRAGASGTVEIKNIVFLDTRPASSVPPIRLEGRVILQNCSFVSTTTGLQLEAANVSSTNCYFWQPESASAPLVALGSQCQFEGQRALFVGSQLFGIPAGLGGASTSITLRRCSANGVQFIADVEGDSKLEVSAEASAFFGYGNWPSLNKQTPTQASASTSFDGSECVFVNLQSRDQEESVAPDEAAASWTRQSRNESEFRSFVIDSPLPYLFERERFLPPQGSILVESMLEGSDQIGAVIDELSQMPDAVFDLLPPLIQPGQDTWSSLLAGDMGEVPAFPETHAIGKNGADVQELLNVFLSAKETDIIEIHTNEPYYLQGNVATRSQDRGTLTIRAGKGFRPVIARQGVATGPLLRAQSKVDSSRSTGALRFESITFADPNPGLAQGGKGAAGYFRLLSCNRVRLSADNCTFIESRGGITGTYNSAEDNPQMQFDNCFFYHVPVETDQGSVDCHGGYVAIRNCLVVNGRFLSLNGSGTSTPPFPSVVADIESSTIVGAHFLTWSSGAHSSLQFRNNIVSDCDYLFGYNSAQPSVADYYDFRLLENNVYFALNYTVYPETNNMRNDNGLANNAQAVSVYRQIMADQDRLSPFYAQSAFSRTAVQGSANKLVKPELFQVPRQFRAKKVGADTSQLPALAPGLSAVLPAGAILGS